MNHRWRSTAPWAHPNLDTGRISGNLEVTVAMLVPDVAARPGGLVFLGETPRKPDEITLETWDRPIVLARFESIGPPVMCCKI
jgi:hypothetical protein